MLDDSNWQSARFLTKHLAALVFACAQWISSEISVQELIPILGGVVLIGALVVVRSGRPGMMATYLLLAIPIPLLVAMFAVVDQYVGNLALLSDSNSLKDHLSRWNRSSAADLN